MTILNNKFARAAVNITVFMWPIKAVLCAMVAIVLFGQYMVEQTKIADLKREAYFASGGVEYDKSECVVQKYVVLCKKGE